MTTHELARAFSKLARILKTGPDIDLDEVRGLETKEGLRLLGNPKRHTSDVDPASVAVNVSTLAALSRLNKTQWRGLIDTWGLPIEIPTTYSARDTIGKLLRYLERHPQAMDKIT